MSEILIVVTGCLTLLVLLVALRIERRIASLERQIERSIASRDEEREEGPPEEHGAEQ